LLPDESLIGVVVHGGLVLARGPEVTAALRQVTAFPAGLVFEMVVGARDLPARIAADLPKQGPGFGSEAPRLAVSADRGDAHELHPFQLHSVGSTDELIQQASYWLEPLPTGERITLTCSWTELGLPEGRHEVRLPDLRERAAAAFSLWS
jgi:hypothetical protein